MKVMKNNKDYFNIELKTNHTRLLLTILVILVIMLLFRRNIHTIIEKLIIFSILFILLLILTKNFIVTLFGSLIIFLLINLNMEYKRNIENFEDLNASSKSLEQSNTKIDLSVEPPVNFGIFEDSSLKKSSDGIQDLLKKINGGIELKDEDMKETKDKLNVDSLTYSDDKKPNALKAAQKEAYELIDTVNALKDTISTLSPVLMEGKKLMSLFENLKL
jgi:energy-coupling factor transporter transmembrane protein EcfT